MECIYDVTLINRSPQLDLRIESGKIASVIRETLDLRPEVTRCDVVQIDQHGMVLSVERNRHVLARPLLAGRSPTITACGSTAARSTCHRCFIGPGGRRLSQRNPMSSTRKTRAHSATRGVSLAGLGRHEEALECYDKALAVDPRLADAWRSKGDSLGDLGRHEEAIECFDEALAIDPGLVAAWYYKGESLYLLGRPEEANVCFDEALGICPGLAARWRTKGYSLAALGRREEALGCYDKVLAIDPQDAAAWENKGASLHAMGRSGEALECCEKALAIEPALVTAWHGKRTYPVCHGPV